MIGNDVIDLDLAKVESNWKRKGFVDKIFTASEQLFIRQSKNPDRMVWALWSRKEAAYKIWNRETNIRKYNPLQFECSETQLVAGNYLGKVSNNEKVYYTKTTIETDTIHTIAVSNINDFDRVGDVDHSIKIQKNNGIPGIYEGNLLLKPISISHHGRFKKIVSI